MLRIGHECELQVQQTLDLLRKLTNEIQVVSNRMFLCFSSPARISSSDVSLLSAPARPRLSVVRTNRPIDSQPSHHNSTRVRFMLLAVSDIL
jgi:hypothetical protein